MKATKIIKKKFGLGREAICELYDKQYKLRNVRTAAF